MFTFTGLPLSIPIESVSHSTGTNTCSIGTYRITNRLDSYRQTALPFPIEFLPVIETVGPFTGINTCSIGTVQITNRLRWYRQTALPFPIEFLPVLLGSACLYQYR